MAQLSIEEAKLLEAKFKHFDQVQDKALSLLSRMKVESESALVRGPWPIEAEALFILLVGRPSDAVSGWKQEERRG